MTEPQRQALSPDNPWPGLDPFDETDRDYFHGRAAESGELLRLVRRELLTVLFGRSGLGKTSLLKAGLFPLLREEDYLPVYVRLDHAVRAPALGEQIFRGLQAACDAGGVQVARPGADESPWSFFHRSDAELWSERNRCPVTPVVVFDQLEEIFTLGQESAASRARSDVFLAELGDLVENRPPDAVRQALEADPTAATRFDFKRSNVKLVLSFREDFLAEMEGLKERMPSLMYNRFRLLAMSGAQAYEVIICAGGTLVDDDVARRIIRLAWKNEPSPPVDKTDFPKIEIDPALLSVVCSELNHKRQQAKPPLARITPTLLEGTEREILSGFYERGMAGLDPRVRAFVEDELITDRGYRDSHAREDALALSGVTSEALDALIRRRLLRVDERQSLRRLELTHDVLARVVKESRDRRHAREAEEAALEQQRRNRRNAAFVGAGALVVIVLAVVAGWFALVASRARQEAAERLREAKSTRRVAESIRLLANAERLQNVHFDLSLLANLEAIRVDSALDITAGLLRRFVSHPQLAAFLTGHRAMVHSVAFRPDGKLLASASADKTVILWDVESRRLLDTLDKQKDIVRSVIFSPNGKLLAWASGDNAVLWDVHSRKPLFMPEAHKAVVQGVAFSPDGKLLASASMDGWVILWEVESRKPLRLGEHREAVTSVAFSPDGKLLASASDMSVILWAVDSRKLLHTFRPKGEYKDVAFSPDGKLLAAASADSTVFLWDVNSRKPTTTLKGHKDTVWSVAFSRDGKRLASASSDQTVMLWRVDGSKPPVTLEGHKDMVLGVAFSPDGELLASASRDPAVILWTVDRRKTLATLKGHTKAVSAVAFSPDSKRLASAGEDRNVILWDVNSPKPRAIRKGHKEHKDVVSDVAFSPDGKRLASASWDRTVILWDIESERTVAPLDELKGVRSVAFSPDGKRLVSAGWDESVNLWDIENPKRSAKIGRHKEHKGAVSSVAFSTNGKRLASASEDNTVILWDMENGKPPVTLEGHTDTVLDVAFSRDGKRLATASRDHTVILWDVESCKPVATLGGHTGAVQSVAFSPDGKRLASASLDHTVILWDVEGRKPMVTLSGHQEPVRSVAFSPDGKRLASASEDQTVILWNLDLGFLMAEACRTANRNLTCEEWRSYIGADKPYRKTCAALPGPAEKCD